MLSVNAYGRTIKLDIDVLHKLSEKSGLRCSDVELNNKTDLIRTAYNPLNILKQLFLGTITFSPWLALSNVCQNRDNISNKKMRETLTGSLVYRICYYDVQTAGPVRALLRCPPFFVLLWTMWTLFTSPSLGFGLLMFLVSLAITGIQISAIIKRQEEILSANEKWSEIFIIE